MKQLFTLFLFAVPLGMAAQQNCASAPAAVPNTIYNVSFAANSQMPATICTDSGSNEALNHAAWYTYTPTTLVLANISTAPASVDTRVHIYSGTCGNLTCVAGDDDDGPDYSAYVTFMADAGVTYYIVFDDNWTEDSFTFTIGEEEYIAPLFTPQYINVEGNKDCVVDMNGDHLDDLVSPSYDWQNTSDVEVNVLYQGGSGFTPATLQIPGAVFSPDWSIAAGDFDKNGYNDLLFGNAGGASIVLQDDQGTTFDEILTSDYVFSQRTNFVDINADGNLDAFVCHDLAPNVFFMNDGNGGFDFEQGGLGDWPSGGNYGSIWIDYDNDGDMDLFIAKCRGGADEAALDELHRNNGDGTFTNIANQVGFANLHQAWSAAWADYDNDGDLDVLIGSSAGAYGDYDPNNPLHAHKLYRNDGNDVFTNVTVGSGYDTFITPSLEHVARDFDNDGYIDVLGGGNTIMHNNGDWTFSPIAIPAGSGPTGDLNNDGFVDIVNGNIIYLNYGNDNNWVTVQLQGIESNGNGIGARVEVYTTTAGIEKQIREIRSGDGFGFMSSLNAHFGLGAAQSIEKIVVKWPSGTIDTIENPAINTPILVTEGQTTADSPVFSGTQLALYPNPAKDVVSISGVENISIADIFDLNGRLVKSADVTGNKISVQHLAKGTYIIRLTDTNGKQHSAKFIKA